MKFKIVELTTLTIVFLIASLPHAATITRTELYGPIRLTYKDLHEIVSRVRNVIENTNINTTDTTTVYWEKLEVRNGDTTFVTPNVDDLLSSNDLPEIGKYVVYTYHLKGELISNVRISLTDHNRTLVVSARNRELANSIVGVVDDEIRDFQTILGGSKHRLLLGLIIFMIQVTFVVINLIINAANPYINAGIIISSILLVSCWILPWTAWLPGVAIYSDTASFFDQHSAEISVFGVVFTVVITTLPYLLRMIKKVKTTS